MGYSKAAATLSDESKYELESPTVAAFRMAILEGEWAEAESLLLGSPPTDVGQMQHVPENQYGEGLVLAEGADRSRMLFWIRQQKYLELLEKRELGMALMVLRQELTTLHYDTQQVHTLSSLLMYPEEEFRSNYSRQGSIEDQRRALLADLTRSIAPSVMIRDHRLAELLDQVKRNQVNECLYHNTAVAPSLYSDHLCDINRFPLRTWLELNDHSGEVWFLQFSHDGTKLATASQDKTVLIYETTSFKLVHRLPHNGHVTYVTWSPDDSKLISCSMDKLARVWDVTTGQVILHVDHHTPDNTHLSAASWAPDSMTFVTSSFDRRTPLCHWNVHGEDSDRLLHKWDDEFRLQDCAISPDGRELVVIDSEKTLYVFDFQNYAKKYHISFDCKLTSLTISRNSKRMLVNLTSGEVRMLDIETGATIRRYEGQKQGQFIIRSTLGGAAENFVVSGSEGMHNISLHAIRNLILIDYRLQSLCLAC